jgi:hypothetical protein
VSKINNKNKLIISALIMITVGIGAGVGTAAFLSARRTTSINRFQQGTLDLDVASGGQAVEPFVIENIGENGKQEVQNLLQNYLQIKEKQNNLLKKIDNGKVLGIVAQQTIEQQKTMEVIKTKIDEGVKQNVIQAQEQVVNQVAKQVVDVNGAEGATEFLNEVARVWAPGTGPSEGEQGHVWAPGTGPGGEAGVVYAGGGKLVYAEGTGPGGEGGVVIEGGEMKFATGTSMDAPGADVKTIEVKTGGGENDSQNLAPGGFVENEKTTIQDDTKTWIDP